jgi:hypothetical protein
LCVHPKAPSSPRALQNLPVMITLRACNIFDHFGFINLGCEWLDPKNTLETPTAKPQVHLLYILSLYAE